MEATVLIRRGDRVGRYVIVDRIGAGRMGVVYAAHDPELDRTVALKLLRQGVSDTDVAHGERLLREARAMARVAHPNVVAVFDAGFHGERIFIAMERVEGSTLRGWLEMQPRRRDDILRVFLEAGRGMAAAHAKGLLHGDFKLQNVLIGRDARVRVTDFGLACVAGNADARSDQFSFAVALQHGMKRSGMPSWMRRALLRALRTDPEERYESMNALLDALGRNPYVRWRRHGVLIGWALASSLALWGVMGMRKGPEPRCQDAALKLAGVWDDARKDAILGAFLATDLPYAEHTFRTVSGSLDAYARQWIRGRTEACEATWVRREQSADRLDARMHCLDARLNEVSALTNIYVHADSQAVQNAVVGAQSLPLPELCAETNGLGGAEPLPSEPHRAAHIDALERVLAEIAAQRAAGHMNEARVAAAAAAGKARELGDARLEAHALYLHGQLLADVQPKDAEAVLYEAAWAADRAHDDATRARVWSELLFVVGLQHRMNEVAQLNSHASAAIERAGGNEALDLSRHQRLGAVLREAGRLAEARAETEAALDIAQRLHGPESWQAGACLTTLGWIHHFSGDNPAALASLERGRAAIERAFGPMHPNVGAALGGVASVLSAQGKHEEAIAMYRQQLVITENAFGPVHVNLATNLNNLADELREQGSFAEAIALSVRALDIQEKLHGPEHPSLVTSLNVLGRAYFDSGKVRPAQVQFDRALRLCSEGTDPSVRADAQFGLAKALGQGDRARALATAARDTYRAAEDNNSAELAEVDAWLRHF